MEGNTALVPVPTCHNSPVTLSVKKERWNTVTSITLRDMCIRIWVAMKTHLQRGNTNTCTVPEEQSRGWPQVSVGHTLTLLLLTLSFLLKWRQRGQPHRGLVKNIQDKAQKVPGQFPHSLPNYLACLRGLGDRWPQGRITKALLSGWKVRKQEVGGEPGPLSPTPSTTAQWGHVSMPVSCLPHFHDSSSQWLG